MTEQTVTDEVPQNGQVAEEKAAGESAAHQKAADNPVKKPARRRAPRRDEVLAEAIHTARAGLAGLAEDEQIGEHRGATVDDDRLMTHRWDAKLPGYRGWQWYATVARAPRSKLVTVCEVGLAAGEDSIVAPAWVPYADRVSEEERERMKAVAEGRDPNRAAESDDEETAAKDDGAKKPADGKAPTGAEAAPETDSASDAEASEAEEAAEEPTQVS